MFAVVKDERKESLNEVVQDNKKHEADSEDALEVVEHCGGLEGCEAREEAVGEDDEYGK